MSNVHLINPVSSLRILKIEDGKGVGLGEGVHVREVPARDGQLHRGCREGADWMGHLDLLDMFRQDRINNKFQIFSALEYNFVCMDNKEVRF